MSNRRQTLWVAGVALLARLATVVWAWGQLPPTADGSYYQRLAERLAAGEGYTWLWPDGAVTFAAHYPVGYPAALAGVYAAFGNAPEGAMLLNALLGTMAAVAVHRLVRLRRPRLALWAGLAVALHPGLVAYTPALMTEGVTASLVVCAAWLASACRLRQGRAARLLLVGCGVLLGLSTLVRPQCVLLAPLFGFLAWPLAAGLRRRLLAAAACTLMTFAVVSPWTLRNCTRMGRCALVSVNGGWNLLIGTEPGGDGGWAPLRTPSECKTVFDEAGKDSCFERAARRRIGDDPWGWLARAPRKLAVTFDYCGAAGWYLHDANPSRFGERAKLLLGVAETAYERVLLLLALLGCAHFGPRRTRGWMAPAGWIHAIVIVGALAACSRHGWLAHVALMAALALRRPTASVLHGAALSLLVTVAAVHMTFFGAGRYQVVVLPLVAALAVFGAARLPALWRAVRSAAALFTRRRAPRARES